MSKYIICVLDEATNSKGETYRVGETVKCISSNSLFELTELYHYKDDSEISAILESVERDEVGEPVESVTGLLIEFLQKVE